MKKFTPLSIIYLLFSIAGIIVPWYFNISHVMFGDTPFSFAQFWKEGTDSYLSKSLTWDFIIGGSPVIIWMMVEARKIGMRFAWVFLILTFMVAFAFAVPLFLFCRELKLSNK